MPKDIKKKILDAMLEVIARDKISGTRMHLIAKEADMTQSNLHYYFPTKNDMLIALLNNMQSWFSANRKRSVDLKEQPFVQNFRAIFDEKKDVILHHKKLDYVQFDYWVQGTADPEVRLTFQRTFNIWRHDIAQVFKQAGREDMDPKIQELLPFLMVSLMMGASMQYLIDEEKFNLDDYFAAAETMIFNLIGLEDVKEGERAE